MKWLRRRKANRATVTINIDNPRKEMGIIIDGELSVENLEKLQRAWTESWKGIQEPVETLKEGQILRLQPGDIVVLSHPGRLSEAAMERVGKGWKSLCERAGIPTIPMAVFEEGMKVGVLRASEEKNPEVDHEPTP